jgi:hypothetical protein
MKIDFDLVFEQNNSLVTINDNTSLYELFIDENGKENWIEYKDGQKIIRNNNDPDLTPDGIPTLEKQLADIGELDKKYEEDNINKDLEKQKQIDRSIKVKSIVLDEMNLSLIFDIRKLNYKDKQRFNDKFHLYWGVEDDFINRKFFKICHETIFAPGADYSNYPVYDI